MTGGEPRGGPVGPVLALEGAGVYVSPFGSGLYVLLNRRHRHKDGKPVFFADNAGAIRELEYAFSDVGEADYRRNGVLETLAVPVQSEPVTGVCTWVTRDAWYPDQLQVRYFVVVRGKFHILDNANHFYPDFPGAVAELRHVMRKLGGSRFWAYCETADRRLAQPLLTPSSKPA